MFFAFWQKAASSSNLILSSLTCIGTPAHSQASLSVSFSLSGVVSVSFEEDEEGNHCLIAYPLHSDPAADLENMDPLAECKPKGEVLKWGPGMSSSLLVDAENYSKDGRGRHSGKDKDKSKR